MYKATAVIPARGSSQRLPRKNLRTVRGKTLLEWAALSVHESPTLMSASSPVIVSTDSYDVGRQADKAGLSWRTREDEIDKPETMTWDIFKHVFWQNPAEVGVMLLPTVPFRRGEHIERTIEALWTSGADIALTITRCEYPPQWCFIDRGDRLEYIGESKVRRENQDPAFYHNGSVLAATPEALQAPNRDGLEIVGVETPWRESIDIDWQWQLDLCELYAQEELAKRPTWADPAEGRPQPMAARFHEPYSENQEGRGIVAEEVANG